MKHKKLLSLFLFSFLIIGLFSCSQVDNTFHNDDKTINVSIVTDNHCKTRGSSVKQVKYNDNVSFNLIFDDGYYFKESTHGFFDNYTNILTVENITKPLTIEVLSTNQVGALELSVVNDSTKGDLTIEPFKHGYEPGDEITISVNPKINNKFLCYSFEKAYRGGYGELTGCSVSFDSKYTFVIESSLTLVVNYQLLTPTSWHIIYDLNGGETVMGNPTIDVDYQDYAKGDVFFPSSINGNYMFRDGYTLFEYNTKEDGTGHSIGIGSKICIDYFTNREITLYCQWKKWTDDSYFEYEDISDSTIKITKILAPTGINELIIPNIINNKTVVAIAENSLRENTITDIYLNIDLEIVEKYGLSNSDNLQSVTLFSSIKEIYDESFDSPTLKTIYLNKNTLATEWDVGWLNISRKGESLYFHSRQQKRKFIFVGHSTILANHDAKYFADVWGEKFTFYKYCGTAGISSAFILYTLKQYLSPNDIIFIPMYHNTLELGPVSLRNFGYMQYDFDSLNVVDYQVVKSFYFPSLMQYSQVVTKDTLALCITPETSFSSEGDIYGGEIDNREVENSNNKAPYTLSCKNHLDVAKYDYLIEIFNYLELNMENILMTWNSYNINNIDPDDNSFVEYEEMIRNLFSEVTFFDTINDHILPGNYFNKDDGVHCSIYGGNQRMLKWLEMIPFSYI